MQTRRFVLSHSGPIVSATDTVFVMEETHTIPS